MMPISFQAALIRRAIRGFALDSATVDKNVTQGDAKVAGVRWSAADDTATFQPFLYRVAAAQRQPPAARRPFHCSWLMCTRCRCTCCAIILHRLLA